jgi:hypothetical protein
MIAFALGGADRELDRAVADSQNRYPLDTLQNEYWIPAAYAFAETRRDRPDEALKKLQPASRFAFFPDLFYARGLALLRANRPSEAAVEFQKVLSLRYHWPVAPYMTLAQLGLARAAAAGHNTAEARKQYQNFLALVKDADPGIPVLEQAKAEYAKLQ